MEIFEINFVILRNRSKLFPSTDKWVKKMGYMYEGDAIKS